MMWAVLPIAYLFKQADSPGGVTLALAVSVALQLIYLSKFYWWEAGYWCSIDIMHDRAGYYLCWGCLNWVPSIYTSQSMYLVENSPEMTLTQAAIIFSLGFICIFVNYDSDNQRYIFRKTGGKALVWGRKPTMIVAKYVTERGEEKQSLLLTSGYVAENPWHLNAPFSIFCSSFYLAHFALSLSP